MTPAELSAAIAGPLNKIGAVHYFHPVTRQLGRDSGLDLFRLYVLGRGGVLGDVSHEIVTSAFGYFHPGLIAKMWESAREKVEPMAAARIHLDAAAAIGAELLADLDGLDAFADACVAVIDTTDTAALPLFAGYAALEIPSDPTAAAMHQAIVMRELRGSIHLAAIAAEGLPSNVVHAHRRPAEVEQFGWRDPIDVTEEHRERIARIDAATEATMTERLAVLDQDQMRALADGTATMLDALDSVLLT